MPDNTEIKKPGETGAFTPQATVTVDFSRVPEEEFAPTKDVRIATVRNGKIVDSTTVTPAKQRNPRSFQVSLSLGPLEDGIAGAQVVVTPADDERNIFSTLTAKKLVAGSAERIDGGFIYVSASIYSIWRFCWFPHTYHITGRVVHHDGNCIHPVGAANVEIYDVDYCWWWYRQDMITSGTTDADGFFDITFTWCRPLWCFVPIPIPPLYVDPHLRDTVERIIREKLHIRWPWPPPPDPWELERRLVELGVALPTTELSSAAERPMAKMRVMPTLGNQKITRNVAEAASNIKTDILTISKPSIASLQMEKTAVAKKISWQDLFGEVFLWPVCHSFCDRYPDIKIRVTQNQVSGPVVIYEDSCADIRWNVKNDLLNLSLEANDRALYSDACRPDPILGNCMLFERVGWFNVSNIYQPDIIAGTASYGTTPDRKTRLGYTADKDRAWCRTISVHGDFGLAAQIDYYQVQYAQWTNADLLAWDANHAYVPPDAQFVPADTYAVQAFVRQYAELHHFGPWFYYTWPTETFAPQTIAGIPALYKTRQKFEKEYRDSHGGTNPAPDFASGWYWDTSAMTRLFNLDTGVFANGLYSFRIVGYRQTGVDATGKPILQLVNMGLANGAGRRCSGAGAPVKPELLTLYLYDHPHAPHCDIVDMKKNGIVPVDECSLLILTGTDSLQINYRAEDVGGNLEYYHVTLQRGHDPEVNIRSMAGVTFSGADPQGPDYFNALTDATSPAIPPYWYGSSWSATVPESAIAALGGSCAYVVRLRAWDRQTDGWNWGTGWTETECLDSIAFTIILASDKAKFCEDLGCTGLLKPIELLPKT
jgi:hypothetical protein